VALKDMIELNSSNKLIAHEKIRIPFFDIDMAGIVWHGHYLKYFELARCVLLDGIGYNYEEMISTGVLWPVVDTSIRYVHPLVLDQNVVVSACLQEWQLRLVIDYRVVDENGVVCTKGTTVQAPVDAKTKALQFGSPELLVNNVERCLQAQAKMTTQ
jgi:acyl-CoA thioester hydrolase